MKNHPRIETVTGKRYRMAARLESLDGIREDLENFLYQAGLSYEAVNQWKLIFTEVVSNAIVHGCKNDSHKEVSIEWKHCGSVVSLAVADPGKGPEEEILIRPALPDDPLETCGRGLYLIHEFCDRWSHWRGREGYRVEIIKKHTSIGVLKESGSDLDEAVEEITLCYESLAAFYRLGDTLIQSDNVAGFIGKTVRDLLPVVGADLASLYFDDRLEGELLAELRLLSFSQLDFDPAGFERKVLETGEECIWDAPEEIGEERSEGRLGPGFCCPIKAGDNTLGYITIRRERGRQFFKTGDLNTVRTFADIFGIAVANADHEIIRTREQRVLRELEIAAEIQKNLLPVSGPPETDRYRIAVERKSAREVAGDYVEASLAGDGSLILVTVDVMGKGISAAFLAAMFRTALHITLEEAITLENLIHTLNHILCYEVGDMDLFATCGLARIPPSHDEIEVVNAGHCPVLVFNREMICAQIEPSGPPLGLFESSAYEIERMPLEKKTGLLMVTDGLYEWKMGEAVWGWGNFLAFLKEQFPLNPEKLWQSLQNKIQRTPGGGEAEDDQTMLFWESKI